MAKNPHKQEFQNTISLVVQLFSTIPSGQENKRFSPRKKMAKK
jgi:hypothetical protein